MALLRRPFRTASNPGAERVAGQDALTWEQRAVRAEAELRSRRMQATMSSGALGGGVLLAGFGLVPGLIGMVIGGLLGYLSERSVDARRSNRSV
jgi:hypothetical protein